MAKIIIKKHILRINNIILLGLLVILFFLLVFLSQRYHIAIDVTQNRHLTLSPASKGLLKKMPGPIHITSYSTNHPNLKTDIRRFIARYQRIKPNIQFSFINPDFVPEETRRLGISINGELLISYQGRIEHVKNLNETHFSTALERLLKKDTHWLAFLTGHGERDPIGHTGEDLGLWNEQLAQRGYYSQSLNLSEIGAIPDNTSILIIADPKVSLLSKEIDLICDYIQQGGNLLWLTEPKQEQHLHRLSELLEIEFIPGKVMDTAGRYIKIDDPSVVLITKSLYLQQPITTDFTLTTIFPGARAIRIKEQSSWQAQLFLTTGNHTWLENQPLNNGPNFDKITDKLGPLDIAFSLNRTKKNKTQRVVVIGDGDFLSNRYLHSSGNLELSLRIINWLIEADSYINIPINKKSDKNLHISNTLLGIWGVVFWFLLPITFLIIAILYAWKRRSE